MALSSGSEIVQSPAGTPSTMITPSLQASSASGPAISDDVYEDCCSICLDPFNYQNPPTLTTCKHEYHLQCILDWSQRSQECPICLQVIVLTDPTCQELLAAIVSERSMRSRSYVHPVIHDHEVSDYLASIPIVTHVVSRRRRQTFSAVNPSLGLPSVSVADLPTIPHHHDPEEECNSRRHGPASPTEPELSLPLPSAADANSNTVDSRDGPLKHRIFSGLRSLDSPSRSSSSELHSLSESVRAKLNSASARYKESLSKSTRGFKEKILARNTSVKELSRGVQREMSASISRVIERLDLSSKISGATIPSSSCPADASNLGIKGKDLEWCVKELPCDDTIHGKSSDILKI